MKENDRKERGPDESNTKVCTHTDSQKKHMRKTGEMGVLEMW